MFCRDDEVYVKSKGQKGKILEKYWTNYGIVYEVLIDDEIIEIGECQLEVL